MKSGRKVGKRNFPLEKDDLLGGTQSVKCRCESSARYIVETGATVRQTAAKFGISKSTVHKDVTERLYYLNPALCREVRVVLEKNRSERHLRGGEATRRKYKGEP